MEREDRYIVFKKSDMEKYFPKSYVKNILSLRDELDHFRHVTGKLELKCVVVESDWPMYETVWRSIQNWVSGESPVDPNEWECVDKMSNFLKGKNHV